MENLLDWSVCSGWKEICIFVFLIWFFTMTLYFVAKTTYMIKDRQQIKNKDHLS